MSSDNSSSSNNNKPPSPPPADMQRNRRGSFSANNPFSTLFTRSNSIATGTPVFPNAITTAAIQEQQRRRLSLSTTTALGMTGTSPTSATGLARRASTSTNSDFDENAIEEEDSASATRAIPSSPFTRRMSFGNPASMRRPGGNSPGSGNDQGFNWSEQLRSRAESSVAGSRPSFSFASGITGSPPRPGMPSHGSHDRARSVSEMPPPPAQAPKPRSPPRADPRPKPDHFQERILKGDFYMD